MKLLKFVVMVVAIISSALMGSADVLSPSTPKSKSPMADERKSASMAFLDAHQYTYKSILKYERIFGHTWMSTGGETTTKDICLRLGLRPGQRVLDIGCGTGGSTFFMARYYGCNVTGLDLSSNVLSIAQDRLSREDTAIKDRVSFQLGDVLELDFGDGEFDVIYSRDTFLYIKDKESLFTRIRSWLKPEGTLLITDYTSGDQEHSEDFLEYVKQRGYFLRTIADYEAALRSAGFRSVDAEDMTPHFVRILQEELRHFRPTREAFVQDFSKEDYSDIVDGWESKLQRVEDGDQAWALFLCKR